MAPRDPRRNTLLLVGALNGLGYGLVFPVAALYGEAAGLAPAAITALVALHALARLVVGPAWGRLSDRVGRRPVLLAGVLLQALGHLVFGLGELRAATGVGMLAGPILGGVLGLVDLAWPGLAAAGFCVVSAGVIAGTFRETAGVAAREPAPEAGGLPLVPRPALVIVGAAAGALALAECIVPLAIEHQLVPTMHMDMPARDAALILSVGVILAWGLTTALFDGFLSARVVARLGALPTARLGLGVWAIAFALTPPVYHLGVGSHPLGDGGR